VLPTHPIPKRAPGCGTAPCLSFPKAAGCPHPEGALGHSGPPRSWHLRNATPLSLPAARAIARLKQPLQPPRVRGTPRGPPVASPRRTEQPPPPSRDPRGGWRGLFCSPSAEGHVFHLFLLLLLLAPSPGSVHFGLHFSGEDLLIKDNNKAKDTPAPVWLVN